MIIPLEAINIPTLKVLCKLNKVTAYSDEIYKESVEHFYKILENNPELVVDRINTKRDVDLFFESWTDEKEAEMMVNYGALYKPRMIEK